MGQCFCTLCTHFAPTHGGFSRRRDTPPAPPFEAAAHGSGPAPAMAPSNSTPRTLSRPAHRVREGVSPVKVAPQKFQPQLTSPLGHDTLGHFACCSYVAVLVADRFTMRLTRLIHDRVEDLFEVRWSLWLFPPHAFI